ACHGLEIGISRNVQQAWRKRSSKQVQGLGAARFLVRRRSSSIQEVLLHKSRCAHKHILERPAKGRSTEVGPGNR
ncbi:hypothetical protein VIGAN_08246900, partial [Vigna angularis var. angularis]